MQLLETELPGVLILEPRVFQDDRGWFAETYNRRRFHEAGLRQDFVQDNHSRSIRGALRGLHYQLQHPQGKLCRVVRGEVWDVAVDLRGGSPTFGRWTGVTLSEANRRQIYVPPGFAHGFCVLSETADFLYKCTDFYYPEHERTLIWDDPTLSITWPIQEPLLSDKDRQGLSWEAAPKFA